MMKKTTLGAAVVLGLTLSASASAGWLNGPTPGANNLAPETVSTAPVALTNTAGTNAWAIGAVINYSLAATEFRAARFECTNATLDGTKLLVTDSGAGTTVGTPFQAAANAIVVSLTQGAAAGSAADQLLVTMNPSTANGITLSTLAPSNCTYSLYDSPANAINKNASGLIYTTGSKPWLTLNPTLSTTPGTQNTQYTAFTATPAFSQFSRTNPGPHFSNTVGMMNSYTFNLLPNSFDKDGGTVTTIPAGAYMSLGTQGVAAGSSITLNSASNCSGSTLATFASTGGNSFATGSLSAATLGMPYYLCYAVPGTGNIPNGTWTAATVTSVAGNTFPAGIIAQDGTTWQATLAQNPNGYQSRIVLTNMSNTAAAYSVSLIGPDGTAQVSTGSLAANRQTQIPTTWDVHALGVNNDPNSFRATANVFVTAGPNQVKGMYQIVNVTTGSISNSQMVIVDPTMQALTPPGQLSPQF